MVEFRPQGDRRPDCLVGVLERGVFYDDHELAGISAVGGELCHVQYYCTRSSLLRGDILYYGVYTWESGLEFGLGLESGLGLKLRLG